MENFLSKSVSELEGWTWTDPIPTRDDSSKLVCTYYRLHQKPIGELEIQELYFFISQNAALEYLVPMALKELEKDLFVETEFYEGDLFHSLVHINNSPNYWASHAHEKRTLIDLYNKQRERLDTFEWPESLRSELKNDFDNFAKSGVD